MRGFPGGSAGKESACIAGDLGLIPGLRRSPGEGKGYPLQYSGLENPMDCIVHGVTKSWTRLSNFHFSLSPEEGLYYICEPLHLGHIRQHIHTQIALPLRGGVLSGGHTRSQDLGAPENPAPSPRQHAWASLAGECVRCSFSEQGGVVCTAKDTPQGT